MKKEALDSPLTNVRRIDNPLTKTANKLPHLLGVFNTLQENLPVGIE
jgi:hypothetical protein